MCCTPGIHHASMSGHQCGHSCCRNGFSQTNSHSRQQIEMLEQSLEGLREEVKHIEEQITELEKEK